MIRLTDLGKIGPALFEIREMLGISRREAARRIAELTGRTEISVNAQVWEWDRNRRRPDLKSMRYLLDVLDMDVALVPRSEDPKWQRVLLSAIDNALRNGSYMTGANLAFEMLCDELGVVRDELPTFDPRWAQHRKDRDAEAVGRPDSGGCPAIEAS
jgi:transcriptional regulator with XRE-family HTH domain